MIVHLINYLTHETYRVKIKKWGDGRVRYYPQFKTRWNPFWLHFTSGDTIDSYRYEDWAWHAIDFRKEYVQSKKLTTVKYSYSYEGNHE